MKKLRILFFALLTPALIFTACQGDTSQAEEKMNEAKEEVEKTAEKAGDMAKEAQMKVKGEISSMTTMLDEKISSLESQIAQASGDAKTELQNQLQKVKDAKDRLSQKMASIDGDDMTEEVSSMIANIKKELGMTEAAADAEKAASDMKDDMKKEDAQ